MLKLTNQISKPFVDIFIKVTDSLFHAHLLKHFSHGFIIIMNRTWFCIVTFTESKSTLLKNFFPVYRVNDANNRLFDLFGSHIKSTFRTFGAVDDSVFHQLLQKFANGVFIFVNKQSNFFDACSVFPVSNGAKKNYSFNGSFAG